MNNTETRTAASALFPRLAGGSAGGKGSGLERLDALIREEGLSSFSPDLSIALPRTFVVGTDSFDEFLSQGDLGEYAANASDWEALRRRFLSFPVPKSLSNRLRDLLSAEGRPIIVRSSSLFEDSGGAPFSGIYSSYVIPNSHSDPVCRLAQLEDAVRFVWAEVFSPQARAYCEEAGMDHSLEKMAVVIQELAGRQRGRWFYPRISGVAQSYNYYPISHAKAQDGLCGVALGLGSWIVNGGNVHRFCPKYPAINMSPPELASVGGQHRFLALDMDRSEPNLLLGENAALEELDIEEAEGTDALNWVVSTWDRDDCRLVPGTAARGIRVLDFAPILKYDALPLARALERVLEACSAREGVPVELEFAVDQSPDTGNETLYLLQVKSLIANDSEDSFDPDALDLDEYMIVSNTAIGHGRPEGVRDIVWIDPESFDRSKTHDMAAEISALNNLLAAEQRPYLLIGPGRWGSRDPWLGVPVAFTDISGAVAVVETQIKDFTVDFSFGSHFLHNLISLKRGYLALNPGHPNHVDWEWLRSVPPYRQSKYAVCTRLDGEASIRIDGVRGFGVVRVAQ